MTLYKNNYLYYTSLLSSKLKIVIFATHTIKTKFSQNKKETHLAAQLRSKRIIFWLNFLTLLCWKKYKFV
jgi:hypothetical protein